MLKIPTFQSLLAIHSSQKCSRNLGYEHFTYTRIFRNLSLIMLKFVKLFRIIDGAFTKEKLGRCKNFIRENKLTPTIDILFLFIIHTVVLVLLG